MYTYRKTFQKEEKSTMSSNTKHFSFVTRAEWGSVKKKAGNWGVISSFMTAKYLKKKGHELLCKARCTHRTDRALWWVSWSQQKQLRHQEANLIPMTKIRLSIPTSPSFIYCIHGLWNHARLMIFSILSSLRGRTVICFPLTNSQVELTRGFLTAQFQNSLKRTVLLTCKSTHLL